MCGPRFAASKIDKFRLIFAHPPGVLKLSDALGAWELPCRAKVSGLRNLSRGTPKEPLLSSLICFWALWIELFICEPLLLLGRRAALPELRPCYRKSICFERF